MPSHLQDTALPTVHLGHFLPSLPVRGEDLGDPKASGAQGTYMGRAGLGWLHELRGSSQLGWHSGPPGQQQEWVISQLDSGDPGRINIQDS